MKLDISTFIPGDPKGQPRPRAFARKMGLRHVARMYDSDVADEWKRAVDDSMRQVVIEGRRSKPSEASISLVLAFLFRRPKSHFDSREICVREHRSGTRRSRTSTISPSSSVTASRATD